MELQVGDWVVKDNSEGFYIISAEAEWDDLVYAKRYFPVSGSFGTSLTYDKDDLSVAEPDEEQLRAHIDFALMIRDEELFMELTNKLKEML